MVRNFIGGQKEKETDSINVNYGRDFKYEILADIVNAKEGDLCPNCDKGKYRVRRGIEVGHAFKLGTCYSVSMDAKYLDKDGKLKDIWMGSYGIGISRLISVIVELCHDEKGIVWPKDVTPFQLELVNLNQDTKLADAFYQQLENAGIEVLYDDREISAGVKFSDADLIGIPVRLVVSAKTGDKIEYKERDQKETELLSLEEVIKKIS